MSLLHENRYLAALFLTGIAMGTLGLPLAFGQVAENPASASTADVRAEDPLIMALGGHHMNATPSELEAIAGGEDALVARLLELRTLQTLPFVWNRSTKVLINYSDREDVQAALAADMEAADRLGIARTLVANIDSVKNDTFRRRLVSGAIRRAKVEQPFASYARSMKTSLDSEIQRMVSQELGSE